MADQPPIPGYIRCDAAHLGARWQFELLSEAPKVACVSIETGDGVLTVGLNRAGAERLEAQLRLFLADWPRDQPLS